LYWAITTIVTVGYGDLTPRNYVEVLFVMIVQLIGTAVFGYMINVIGITVD
jgi:potassium voltage-gated channel Eag-related subfamily H protein 5/cyclic nucleotide gated channel alpha 1